MKILITGFEPFGGEEINPSWEAVEQLCAPERTELIKLRLPVVFREAGEQLAAALAREKPDLTLCIGQAAGREAITPERIGVNLMDASIPDNAGFLPHEEPVIPGAPAAYFARLPVKELAEAIRAEGIPARVSNSAGLFVCNALLFRLLHEMETRYPRMRGGFLHVPCLPEQAERLGKGKTLPSLELEAIVRGLEAALNMLNRTEE